MRLKLRMKNGVCGIRKRRDERKDQRPSFVIPLSAENCKITSLRHSEGMEEYLPRALAFEEPISPAESYRERPKNLQTAVVAHTKLPAQSAGPQERQFLAARHSGPRQRTCEKSADYPQTSFSPPDSQCRRKRPLYTIRGKMNALRRH